jgi:hypothetical protein
VAAGAQEWPQVFRSGRRFSEVAAGFQPAEKHVQVENLHPLWEVAAVPSSGRRFSGVAAGFQEWPQVFRSGRRFSTCGKACAG